MTLVKMSPGAWRYYAEEIANGREDYWAEEQSPGCWVGPVARALGLEGVPVSAEALERLFDWMTGAGLGRGATLHGCHIRPAGAPEKDFAPFSLVVAPESPRKTGGSATGPV